MSQFFRQAQDPVSCATHAWGAVAAFFGGMVLLLGLMALVMYNDITKLITG